MINKKKNKIAVIGLGYVGLPLAVEFSKKLEVVGYDYNSERINELKTSYDRTNEIKNKNLLRNANLSFTSKLSDVANSNIFIVAVPTPVNKKKEPDLSLLKKACKSIGKFLKKNDIVIFESTVYPGTTEEVCVPILEKISSLTFNDDFYCGYSPERMNPGDRKHNVTNIVKIVSGSSPKTKKFIFQLYSMIVSAGVHKVSSIKVAEAAKIIENTQRDLNIALMNELSIIFRMMNIDTYEVIDAASTKWNFIKFHPGLVGGHCIGVDPYYLTFKSKQLGYEPKIISAGRKLNDDMGNYVSKSMIAEMEKKIGSKKKYHILILGYTFKENCNDYRNTKVADIYNYFSELLHSVEVYDPKIDFRKCDDLKEINFIKKIKKKYDGIIIAVPHKEFKKMGIKKIKSYCKSKHVVFDVKNLFHEQEIDLKL